MKDLLSTTSCAICTSTSSGEGSYIDNDTLSSMATSTATYLSMNSNQVIIVQAQDYVNSMSIEQLVEFDQKLAEKELDFIEMTEVKSEQPKVYTKTL